jgi:phage gp46-like protein
VPEVENDHTGSRLWLLDRSKRTPDVLDRAVTYGREALQWLLDDRVCERFDFVAEFTRSQRARLRGDDLSTRRRDPAKFRFDHTWTAEARR